MATKYELETLATLQRLGREAESKRRTAEKNIAEIEKRLSYEANPGLTLAGHGMLMDSLYANECVSRNMTAAIGAYARAALELGCCRYDEFLAMIGAMEYGGGR